MSTSSSQKNAPKHNLSETSASQGTPQLKKAVVLSDDSMALVTTSPAADNAQQAAPPSSQAAPLGFQGPFTFHQRPLDPNKPILTPVPRQQAVVTQLMAENRYLKSQLDDIKSAFDTLMKKFTDLESRFATANQAPENPPAPEKPAAPPANPIPTAPPSSYADAAKKNCSPPKSKKPKKPVSLRSAARVFETPAEKDPSEVGKPQFDYLYLPNKYRLHLSAFRAGLRTLGVDTGRIQDIHYPAKGVVAILVHKKYLDEVTAVFKKQDILPLSSFDPFASANVSDPAFLSLSPAERSAKARTFQRARLARGLQHMHSRVSGLVAHSFILKGWLTVPEVKLILAGKSLPDLDSTHGAHVNDPDVKMKE